MFTFFWRFVVPTVIIFLLVWEGVELSFKLFNQPSNALVVAGLLLLIFSGGLFLGWVRFAVKQIARDLSDLIDNPKV